MMRRAIVVGVLFLIALAWATPAAAVDPPTVSPPATVEKFDSRSFPITLSPTDIMLAALGGGTYSGRITWVPILNSEILPHGQVENSRFDFAWTGDLYLSATGLLLPVLLASPVNPSEMVGGHAMVHLQEPLPNDPESIAGIPLGIPVTPYSITITLDEPVYLLPAIYGETIEATSLQIAKGKLFKLK